MNETELQRAQRREKEARRELSMYIEREAILMSQRDKAEKECRNLFLSVESMRIAWNKSVRTNWESVDDCPEGAWIVVVQYTFEGYFHSPMLMSKNNGIWYWEPQHIASSVVPTHWLFGFSIPNKSV